MLVCGSCSLTFCFVSIRRRYQLKPSLTYACGPIHTLLHFQAWQLGQSVPQILGSEPNDVPRACRLLSPRSPLVHCSTDFVFDGMTLDPYLEDHPSMRCR